jgi:hypothetical protein
MKCKFFAVNFKSLLNFNFLRLIYQDFEINTSMIFQFDKEKIVILYSMKFKIKSFFVFLGLYSSGLAMREPLRLRQMPCNKKNPLTAMSEGFSIFHQEYLSD